MKITFLLFSVVASCQAYAMYSDFWRFFPPQDQWKLIIKRLSTEDDIEKYVENYRGPFVEYQAIEKSSKVYSSSQVRECVLNTLNLIREAASQFKITSGQFTSKTDESYTMAIEDATSIFETNKAQRLLDPIFTPKVIRAFVMQRFEDMIHTSATHHLLNNQREQFKVLLNTYADEVKIMRKRRFNQLVPITLDLEEVRRQLVQQLILYQKAYKNHRESRRIKKAIRQLGNEAVQLVHVNSIYIMAGLVSTLAILFL